MLEFSWRGMKTGKGRMVRDIDIAATPAAILDSLCSLGLPIRIYRGNVLRPDWCGILEGFRQNGQLYLQIKMLNVAAEGRSRDGKIEETKEILEILFNKDISLELPVFVFE